MKYVFLLAVFILVSTVSYSQLTEYEKNAQSFEIEKVKLGCTLKSFLAKHPSAREYKGNDAEVGAKTYFVTNLKSANDASFTFYKNKLYSMSFTYSNKQINESGTGEGHLLFAKTILKKIGTTQKQSNIDNYLLCVWDFDNINYHFYLKIYDNLDMYFLIQNGEIMDKIAEEKKKITDFDF